MNYLALDIGSRRTGVAFLDEQVGIPLPLDTIRHRSVDALIGAIIQVARARSIDEIVVGLPLLLSGEEGSQSQFVRDCAKHLTDAGFSVRFTDERYSTPRRDTHYSKHEPHPSLYDGDAASACALLQQTFSAKTREIPKNCPDELL